MSCELTNEHFEAGISVLNISSFVRRKQPPPRIWLLWEFANPKNFFYHQYDKLTKIHTRMHARTGLFSTSVVQQAENGVRNGSGKPSDAEEASRDEQMRKVRPQSPD